MGLTQMKRKTKEAARAAKGQQPATQDQGETDPLVIERYKRQDKELTGNPFAGLGEALSSAKLAVPTLESLAGVADIGSAIEEKKKAAEKIREGIAAALIFLLEVFRRLTGCADNDERRFVKEELADSQEKAQAYLGQTLEIKGALGTIAATAYLRTVLTMDYQSAEEVQSMLHELVERKLLVVHGKGPAVQIGYQNYSLGDFGFDADDIRVVTSVVEQFSRAVKTRERERRTNLRQGLLAASEITLDQALAGEDGKCLLSVPPEAFTDRDGKNRWRGGGEVLFQFSDKVVTPVRASGSVENLIADISDRGGRLVRASLKWETPPHIEGLARDFAKKLGLRDLSVARDKARDFLTLWHIIQRGIRHAEAVKEQETELAELTARAEITPVQFFGLNGSGSPVFDKPALLQLKGVIRLDTSNLYNPFLLVQRGVEDGQEVIGLSAIPAFLEGYLGKYVGRTFPASDRRACPELSNLLHQIRGQQEMAVATATADSNPASDEANPAEEEVTD